MPLPMPGVSSMALQLSCDGALPLPGSPLSSATVSCFAVPDGDALGLPCLLAFVQTAPFAWNVLPTCSSS